VEGDELRENEGWKLHEAQGEGAAAAAAQRWRIRDAERMKTKIEVKQSDNRVRPKH
jgi:hypothetical protein